MESSIVSIIKSPLLRQFASRNIKLKHKGSILGATWTILNPLLLLVLYLFVFGYIFGGSFKSDGSESRLEYALGIFIGLSLFHFLSEILAIAPTDIINNPNLVKKVVFPLEILPVASALSAAFHWLITLVLILIGVQFIGPGISWHIIYLPLLLLPIFALGIGISWIFSALGVYIRDLAQATQFISLALMFGSAVFYPAHSIPPAVWKFMRFNPVIHAIELTRDLLLWQHTPNLKGVLYLFASGFATLFIGKFIFSKLKSSFADVI